MRRHRSTAPSRLQRILHINLPGILPTAIIMFILDVGQVMNMGFEKYS